MPKYAKDTNVSLEMSRLEIERTLIKYGATGFMYANVPGKAMIAFTINNRQVRFILPLPQIDEEEFRYTPQRKATRSESSQCQAWEQACRQRWRALNLVIKAKLEAVECGISIFDDEFMANIVLPDNQTIGEHMRCQIETAYKTGKMPPMLPMM